MIVYKYSDQTTNYLDGVRKWFPNKSLPAVLTKEILLSLGVEMVEDVVPELTLAELKNIKLADLQIAFNQYVSGSIATTQGYKMQFGELDSLKIEGSIKLMEAQGIKTAYLTDVDNVTHYDIPLSTIKAVQLEMLAAYGAAHAKKQELRTQVEVATDKTALSAIIINF